MMDGADKEACEKKWQEVWYAAAAKCSQTECEQKADAEYDSMKNECLANGGTAAVCEEEAQAHKKKVLEECECYENAHAEYDENIQQCEGLEGDEYTNCMVKMRTIFAEALEECTPKEPTECEQIADAYYQEKKDECLANGGSED
jgi:hypothetical protein